MTVRSNDPATAKVAARPTIVERVLSTLILSGSAGMTGRELSEHLDIPLNSITPRFAQLSRPVGAGYMMQGARIKDSGVRRDGQIVWVAL